jgi:hypothetical protein
METVTSTNKTLLSQTSALLSISFT